MKRQSIRQKDLQMTEAARRADEEKKNALARAEEQRRMNEAAKAKGKNAVDPKASAGLSGHGEANKEKEAGKKGVSQKQSPHLSLTLGEDDSSRKRPLGTDIPENSKKQKVADEQPSKVGPIPPEIAVDFFARFSRPGEELPPKEVLLQDEEYTELAIRTAELCAAVNSRFHAGVEEVLKAQRKVKEYELAFEHAKKEAERVLKEAAGAEEKVTLLAKNLEEAETNCAGLAKRLKEVESAFDGRIREAVSKARAEVKATYEEKRRRADNLTRRLVGGLFDNAIHLGQTTANLELIDLLLGENPPSLQEEKKKWEGRRDQMAKAEEEFDNAADALKLLLSSGPTPSSQSRSGVESVEDDKRRKMKPADLAEINALADSLGRTDVGASSKGASSEKEPVVQASKGAAPITRSKGPV